ncbi:MarR family winged helix-turn-helix transcriptional regulator [Methylobacterium brachythecii]|uniref:MarR family transcriptional regulator n=1 Tax=Methylobacterium brachythecii TaxID=1176177 RepID=A0A7W6F9R6_9HYPH|nr:MarR family winged helix-turn-helix transcriptional regulator [Methylobacterium brachythecii]MBB3905436.1 DNA-binding MarR family transcriptional regulator [Methylobacterium brachythecii]GLS44916.1 MarR family transcriptional regulator [Methylobacterium brachythecii]
MAGPREITPDLARMVGEACIGTRIQRAARSVSRVYDAAFRTVGISGWQFTLLMTLAGPETPTINELAARLSLDPSTATTNLKVLERRGLVAVGVDESDRRVRRLTLTEAGRALIAEALPRWEEAQKESLGRLSAGEIGVLRKALAALAE